MSKEYLGGRTITVTYMGFMNREETEDFLAEQIAKVYFDKKMKEGQAKENENRI